MFRALFRSRYAPIFQLYLLYILLGLVLRCVLILITPEGEEFAGIISVIGSFLLGIAFDTVTASYILFLWFIVITCVPKKSLDSSWYRILTYLFAFIQIFFMVFVFVSEITFWEEFTTRFNFIAVDYLIYTQEVVQNIMESYPIGLLIGSMVAVSSIILYILRNALTPRVLEETTSSRILVPSSYIVFICVTGFFVSAAWKNFSQNTLNNSLAGNGVYEFVGAYFNNQLDYSQFYSSVPLADAVALVRKDIEEEGGVFLEPASSLSFYHKRTAKNKQNNLNMVLVIVESFSSKYLTRFGEGRNITPFLDGLSRNSLFFSNLFATGTRTVRGLEALSLSLPPTPGQSIVRRPNNTDFITMGEILQKAGYDTYFYYGGYGYFDNMNAYFSGNSYESVDRVVIPEEKVVFANAWGVADESLYDAVIESIDRRAIEGKDKEKPFFYTVLTTSNHRPFTYPEGRIDIPSGEGRHGAVKYTDWSIGDFLTKAAKKPWFKDTIFVIVADHTAGGAGKTDLPLKRYHIPMFVYAPEHIKPQDFDLLTSQIDVVPTLLGLLDVSYISSFMGYNMFELSSPAKARAFIGTYQDLGYYSNGILTILKPKFVVRQENASTSFIEQTERKEMNKEDSMKAISYYQYASYLFSNGLLRVPSFSLSTTINAKSN